MTWAQQIKYLDGDRCAFCGSTKRLEAHHIRKASVYPDISKSLENGITLCHTCHYTVHAGNFTNNGKCNYMNQQQIATPSEISDFIEEYAACKIVFAVPKGKKEAIQAHAEACGESVNGFINRAISQAMERDKATKTAAGHDSEA